MIMFLAVLAIVFGIIFKFLSSYLVDLKAQEPELTKFGRPKVAGTITKKRSKYKSNVRYSDSSSGGSSGYPIGFITGLSMGRMQR